MGKYIRQKSGGGKVPKCITSTTKDTIIILYFIPIDKNIAEYKVYFLPDGLNSVPASSTHY